jgi:hypothetical protein
VLTFEPYRSVPDVEHDISLPGEPISVAAEIDGWRGSS